MVETEANFSSFLDDLRKKSLVLILERILPCLLGKLSLMLGLKFFGWTNTKVPWRGVILEDAVTDTKYARTTYETFWNVILQNETTRQKLFSICHNFQKVGWFANIHMWIGRIELMHEMVETFDDKFNEVNSATGNLLLWLLKV